MYVGGWMWGASSAVLTRATMDNIRLNKDVSTSVVELLLTLGSLTGSRTCGLVTDFLHL